MENRWIFRSLFLNLGISSLLFQVLLLRELVVSFYGNEFFVGLVLALWLFWTAVGSFAAGRIRKDFLVAAHLFISLLIPTLILFIRFFKIPGTTGGEIPNFFVSLIFVATILAPSGLAFGSIFSLGIASPFANASGDGSAAYFWETVGHILIGLVFNFFLITAPALPVAFLLAALNLGMVGLLVPKGVKGINLAAALFVVVLGIWGGRRLESFSQRWRFPDLVHQENSFYGHIAVTKTGDQYNFYESGLFAGADKDYYAAEFLVHLVLVHQPEPHKALLIGGGWNGVLAEILKYPSVEKIDYVELDPRFLEIVEKYLSPELQQAFNDPRVKKHFVDGRYFLKHASETYDVVIFNLPNPSTALINRFYTKECFAEVVRILDPKGLFALGLSTPTDYLSEETENLLASVYKTLRKEFPEVQILAEEGVLFVGGKGIRGLKGLNVETSFLTDEELEYRLTSDKNTRIQRILEENKTVKLNSDFYPAAYFYQTLFWQTKFSFFFAKILAGLQQPVFGVLVCLLFSVICLLFIWRKPSLLSMSSLAVLNVGLGGLTLMATEIILIFLFQTVLGFVYSKIALLMTLVLGGLAVGNFLGRRWGERFKGVKGCKAGLLAAQGSVIIYLFFLARFVPQLTGEVCFYILGIVIGILVGLLFPLANELVGDRGGVLYAADLAGSFFGALLPSLFLIPLFGVVSTSAFLIILNLVGIMGWVLIYDRKLTSIFFESF